MSSLQEAFVSAKLATEEQVKKAKAEVLKEEEKKKPKEQRQPSAKIILDSKFDPFEKLWNNEKSKQFVIHLLHSFLPFPENHIIWSWGEKKEWKNGRKCCICQMETLAKQDLFEHFPEVSEAGFESLRKQIRDEDFNPSEFMKEKIEKIFGKRIVGNTSERTSCIMCATCYQTFANWVPTKMLRDQFGEFSKVISSVWRNVRYKSTSSNEKRDSNENQR